MIGMRQCNGLKWSLLTAFACLFGSLWLSATASSGTFLLMSHENGGGEWHQADGKWRSLPPLLHIDQLSDSAWRTDQNQAILLGLSNRSLLALAPESAFSVTQFNQQPFFETSLQPGIEPSASVLQIHLKKGGVLFKSCELRVNTSIALHSNHGVLQIHSGTVLMKTSSVTTQIRVLDGSASFTPVAGEKVFLAAATSYLYHPDQPPLRHDFSEAQLDPALRQLHRVAIRGFSRLAVIPPAHPGFRAVEQQHRNRPRALIVQPLQL
jgi:hypothetical protein